MDRSHESPMDFEWANQTGPINSQSPFITAARQVQEKGTKRPFGVFGSPTKAPTPSLRDPSSVKQNFLFSTDSLPRPSSPDKPLPPTPSWFNNPKFNTPRKVQTDFASSNENTPNSPEKGEDDSDATPEIMGLRSRAGNLFRSFTGQKEGLASSKKEDKSKAMASPGRGEVARGYSNKVQKRVEKRRNRNVWTRKKENSYDTEDSGADSDYKPPTTRKVSSSNKQQNLDTTAGAASQNQSQSQSQSQSQLQILSQPQMQSQPQTQDPPPYQPPKGPGKMVSLFSYIEQHPSLPHILSFYAQFLLNVFLCCGIMYLIYCFWTTVRADVDDKAAEATAEVLAEIAVCAQHYRDNRCERETRAPALEAACEAWSRCMEKDAKRIGRARVSAKTFAEIFNNFVEPISYKAMIFTFLLIFGSIVASNFAFGFFRNKTSSNFHAPPPYSYPPPPPTPQRHFSGGYLEHGDAGAGGYWTPHVNRQLGLEPAPSGANPYGGNEGRESPVKKLTFY